MDVSRQAGEGAPPPGGMQKHNVRLRNHISACERFFQWGE
jgi:hypothetical protein